MKKIALLFLLLPLVFSSALGQRQAIKIVSFTVKNQLPASVDAWNSIPGALLLVAQKPPNPAGTIDQFRLVVQIKSNGAFYCGNNPATGIPVDHFTTRSFQTGELSGALMGCHDLKEGSYMICAQFFNIDKAPVSEEVCKPFIVESPKEIDYTPPTLITPENGKAFSLGDLQKPVMFRWTPLVPKPRETVTYRLRVWQLMQGQNGMQAMRSNQPIVSKEVDNITQAVVTNMLTGPCKPPYLCDFIWNVQAINKERKPMGRNEGTSEPWTFTVKEPEIRYTIRNVFPEDNKQLTLDQAKQALTFRWTTVTPRPTEPFTYKLRVWQLMEGQSREAAIKNNPPLQTLDLDDNGKADPLTDGILKQLLTGPCKPPYLCDFVWNVEVLLKHAAGQNNVIASSSPTAFAVNQYIIQLDSIKVNCTDKPGTYSFSYTLTNPNAGPSTLNQFIVTSSVPAGATITSFSPPINTTIGPGNQLTITGTINGAVNLSNICIGAEIKDVGNAFWKASKDTCITVGPCKCDACDSVKIDIVQKDIQFNGKGNIILNSTISLGPKKVKTVKAELVYYEYKPESDDCMICNKDSRTFGNFDAGTLDNTNGTGTGTHSLLWNFIPPKNLSGGTGSSMTITVPPTVKCCDALIRWCIRYVVTFEDCTVCNKLICYEKKKEGCAKGNANPVNDQK